MGKVRSFEPLAAYMHYPLDDGKALIYLRRNIEQEVVEGDEGPMTGYVADEVSIVADVLEPGDVPALFDNLWDRAVREGMSDSQMIEELASANSDNMLATAELGALVADNATATEELFQAVAELGVLIGGGE